MFNNSIITIIITVIILLYEYIIYNMYTQYVYITSIYPSCTWLKTVRAGYLHFAELTVVFKISII